MKFHEFREVSDHAQVVPAVPFMRPVTPRVVHSSSSTHHQVQDGPTTPTATRPTTSAGVWHPKPYLYLILTSFS